MVYLTIIEREVVDEMSIKGSRQSLCEGRLSFLRTTFLVLPVFQKNGKSDREIEILTVKLL